MAIKNWKGIRLCTLRMKIDLQTEDEVYVDDRLIDRT